MPQLTLFDEPEPLAPQAARLAPRLRALADARIRFGTSSWKFEGWLGSIYSTARYETRGKFSKAKFEAECLEEYARIFPTVGGDFAFYQFPSSASWRNLFDALPSGFRIGLKVPEDITAAVWPNHDRYGARAGLPNEHFLDVNAFKTLFASRLQPHVDKLGPIIFEFGNFSRETFPKPADFAAALGPFLGTLPAGFRYGVEVRNPEYLTHAHFALLADHNVAHTYSAWTRMPELSDQAAIPEADTADFFVMRALSARGRIHEATVRDFHPFDRIRRPEESIRAGIVALAEQASRKKKEAFLFVGNRLEGNSPGTIEAVISALGH